MLIKLVCLLTNKISVQSADSDVSVLLAVTSLKSLLKCCIFAILPLSKKAVLYIFLYHQGSN